MRNVSLTLLVGSLLGLSAASTLAAPPPAAKDIKAAGSVEMKDAAGDMGPIHTSGGDEPPLDVVLLAVKSDGKRLTFAATLNDPPGRFASDVVRVYIDADNNPATGIKELSRGPGGFEYEAKLDLCMKYSDGSEACQGGSSKAKPTERYAAIDLKRFKGDSEYGGSEDVLDAMGFPGTKKAVQVPVTGKVVEAGLDYADIGVKPGQTIRLRAQESGGNPKDDGFFPTVVLTLK